VQSLEHQIANNDSVQIIKDLKQKLDKFEKADADSIAKSTFPAFNDKIRDRIHFMAKTHEWISLGDDLAQIANPGYTEVPAIDTYMEQRENF